MSIGLPAKRKRHKGLKSTPQTAQQISPHVAKRLTVGADHHNVIREAHGKKQATKIHSLLLPFEIRYGGRIEMLLHVF